MSEKGTNERLCPICGRTYSEYPALSRAEAVGEICPDCGMKEALEAYERHLGLITSQGN